MDEIQEDLRAMVKMYQDTSKNIIELFKSTTKKLNDKINDLEGRIILLERNKEPEPINNRTLDYDFASDFMD